MDIDTSKNLRFGACKLKIEIQFRVGPTKTTYCTSILTYVCW